jgi:hypothetical protein
MSVNSAKVSDEYCCEQQTVQNDFSCNAVQPLIRLNFRYFLMSQWTEGVNFSQ